MKLKIIAFTGLLLLTFTLGAAAYQPEQEKQTLAELTITDFADGDTDGFVITEDGVVMTAGANTAVYTSPILQSTIPFNAIVPNWITNLEDAHDLGFLLRTRAANGEWTPWQTITTHADWNDPTAEKSLGEMVFTPNAAELHTEIQYTVSMGQQHTTAVPHISQVGFTLIDSTHAPTTEELLQQQQALNATQGIQSTDSNNPRPTVISRSVWCTHADCNYTNGLEYIPATHLVVHHTATPNWGPGHNWPSVVLAMWDYHTHSLGWGDIGYNYLVDTNGIIYEGHLNADYENLDVVSIHAGGANSGSMGVSLIGSFTAADGISPSQPMLNSVVNLLAWKAEQRSINVYDAGNELPNINWGLPYLMGHRDVYGATDCPGDQLHLLLPWLRSQVGTRLNLVDPYLYFQESGPEFSKSSANWQVPIYYCGHNMHAYYTWSTTNPGSSTNWGQWEINVPQNGRYSIEAHIPFCNTGRDETNGAQYTINHALGSSKVVRSQNNNVGLWMNLGEYEFSSSGSHSVQLSDLTTSDSGLGVWFDSLRLRRVGDLSAGQINHNTPANGFLTNNPAIQFGWATTSSLPVLSTKFQLSQAANFSSLAHESSWNTAVFATTRTLSQDGTYYWRVSTVLDRGNGATETITSTPTSLTLDTTPPTSTITGIYKIPNAGYVLVWQGSDATAGIAAFNVQYRQQGAASWTNWLTNTAVTSATFIPPDETKTYEFRVQATDKATNSEPLHANADVNTNQAILLSHAIMLPLVTRP